MIYLFTADWCQHCKELKPQIKDIIHAFKVINIDENLKADTEEGNELIKQFGVKILPTIVDITFEMNKYENPSAEVCKDIVVVSKTRKDLEKKEALGKHLEPPFNSTEI